MPVPGGSCRLIAISCAALWLSCAAAARADVTAELIDKAMAGDWRSDANRARDQYRHPKETLLFFGLQPDMTVVEITPAMGWYTEILAAVLRDNGKFYAAGFAVSSGKLGEAFVDLDRKFRQKLAARPDIYDRVTVTEIMAPEYVDIAPRRTVDLVVTFRNVHNWAKRGNAYSQFKAFHDALKPGGILGVVDHRAAPGTPFQTQIDTGYMTEAYVIEVAEMAGFQFEAKSEVNANASDTKDHPKGVWTLPPTLALGDTDKAKYLAVGESDRMTLKFRKKGGY